MAVKPVSLTYIGDASEALKWVGFAKKKARQLGEWCAATGMPTGQNYISPVPDVSIRVWYTNGLLNARIEASGGLQGVAFWAFTSSFTSGWGIPYTELNSPMGTAGGNYAQSIVTSKLALVRGNTYPAKLGLAGKQQSISNPAGEGVTRLQFGGLVTQEKPKSPAFTVHRHTLNTRYKGADGSTANHREDFCRGGVAYNTVKPCHGAFKFNGHTFAILHDGTFNTTHFTREFNAGSKLAVYKVVSLYSPATWENVGEVDVTGYCVATNFPGVFKMSTTGALGVGLVHDVVGTYADDLANPRIRPIYLQMSYDSDTDIYTATFTVTPAIYSQNLPLTTVSVTDPLDTTGPCPSYETDVSISTTITPDLSGGQCRKMLAYDVVSIADVETIVCAWILPKAGMTVATTNSRTATPTTLRWYNYWAANTIPPACPTQLPDVTVGMTEDVTITGTSTALSDIVIYKDTALNGTLTEVSRYSGLPITMDGTLAGGTYSYSAQYTVRYFYDTLAIPPWWAWEITTYPTATVPVTAAVVTALDLTNGLFSVVDYTGNYYYGAPSNTTNIVVTQKFLKFNFSDSTWSLGTGRTMTTGTIPYTTQSTSASFGASLPSEVSIELPQVSTLTAGLGGVVPDYANRDNVVVIGRPQFVGITTVSSSFERFGLYKLEGAEVGTFHDVDTYMELDTATSEALQMKRMGII